MSETMQDERMYLVQNEFETGRDSVETRASNIMTANCVVCGEKMHFEEGDTIFGEKWFHKICSESKTEITM